MDGKDRIADEDLAALGCRRALIDLPDHIALANSKPEDELATVSIDDAPAKPPLAGDVS